MLRDSWRSFKMNIKDLDIHEEPEIYRIIYWENTYRITTDLEIGIDSQKNKNLKEDKFI